MTRANPKWPWRRYLTPDEAKFIKAADVALEAIEAARRAYHRKYGLKRLHIANRAIQRAKYAAKTGARS